MSEIWILEKRERRRGARWKFERALCSDVVRYDESMAVAAMMVYTDTARFAAFDFRAVEYTDTGRITKAERYARTAPGCQEKS